MRHSPDVDGPGRDKEPPQSMPSSDDTTESFFGDDYYGVRLENYRIIRTIGEGGMGIVFEAEQLSPRRRVALKIVRGGPFAGARAERLFQREIKVLARLRHSAIAAIYESGKTSAGQLFYSMELANGRTLDAYLHKPDTLIATDSDPLRARLELFQRIASAVNYAHQRGVIHRDLKPSNILVADRTENSGTFSGIESPVEVKLLDFGLARVLEPEAGEETMMTASPRIEGTLAYMSPEQASGNSEEVDVRTDVYSLGLLLYLLVCGRLPYDVGRLPLHEATRIICQEPIKPVTTSLTRSNKVGQDLVTIISRALEKDPAQRYESVSALAEDLRRYLANEPIVARAPSTIYQLQKMIARHKAIAIFSSALAVVILAAGILLALQARRVRIEADTSRRVSQFMMDLFLSGDPGVVHGRDLTVAEALQTGSKRVESELANDAEIQSRLQLAIGKAFQNLGDFKSAQAQYEASLKTRKRIHGADSLEAADVQDEIASVCEKLRSYAQGVAASREAVAIRVKRLGNDDYRTAESKHQLALNLSYLGDYPESDRLYGEALPVAERRFGAMSVDVAPLLSDYAQLKISMNDLDGAEQMARRALEIRKKAFPNGHRLLAYSLDRMTYIALRRRELAQAEQFARESMKMRETLFGSDSPETGTSIMMLGSVLTERGQFETALELYQRKIDIDAKAVGKESARVAQDLVTYAQVLGRLKRQKENKAALLRALAIQSHLPNAELAVAATHQELGDVARRNGDYAEALGYYLKAFNTRMSKLGEHHVDTATSKVRAANMYFHLKRLAEGEWLVQSGTDELLRAAPTAVITIVALIIRAEFHEATDRLNEARADFEKALAIAKTLDPQRRQSIGIDDEYAAFCKRHPR